MSNKKWERGQIFVAFSEYLSFKQHKYHLKCLITYCLTYRELLLFNSYKNQYTFDQCNCTRTDGLYCKRSNDTSDKNIEEVLDVITSKFTNLGAKYLVFVSSRSVKLRELSFAQFVDFLRKVCLFFNFWMIKFTIMSNKT